MVQPKVSDIIGIINKIAPFAHAEGWDNVGLQVGDPAMPSDRIMVALDPCKEAVDAAVAAGCRLLLTHHPLLFSPLKKISLADPTGSIVSAALKNDLSIVALHTNYDIAEGGVNDLLAQRLGVEGGEPLKQTGGDELVKLAVFVPVEHKEKLLDSLVPFSAKIGNYSDCSFGVEGTGTFKPLDGARPFLGQVGKRERVEETRLEVLLQRKDLAAAINAMLKAHPYEEPAFDLYPVLNQGKMRGLGRIGRLIESLTLEQFARRVKEMLGVETGRLVGNPCRIIRKVALCGGSGMSLMHDAVHKGADVFVTGDIKYHEAREAEALGMALIDAGHFGTERIMIGGLAETLGKELAKRKFAAEIVPFSGEQEPFRPIV
jgi:dinuclear metal center YbgI/SA1388 family protein